MLPPYEISEPIMVAILAIIQGIAEFLPISSSGHLVVANGLFGTSAGATGELTIILHFGTLLAILVFYWKRIWALLTEDRRVIWLLIVGTIPVAVVGLIVETQFEWVTEDALLAGFMLPVTGFILMGLTRIGNGEKDYQQIGLVSAFVIGIAQAVALLPGISRSGTTIVMGAMLGLKRQSAATFSFLLAIPAIAGATVLKLKKMHDANWVTSTDPVWLIIGCVIAFLVGLAALYLLVKWVEKGKLHLFAYWLIPLGFAVVVWQLYLHILSETA